MSLPKLHKSSSSPLKTNTGPFVDDNKLSSRCEIKNYLSTTVWSTATALTPDIIFIVTYDVSRRKEEEGDEMNQNTHT